MDALILAAGKGTRFRSEKVKVLHEVLGRPMLEWILETVRSLGVKQPKIIIGNQADQVRTFVDCLYAKRAGRPRLILQKEQRGTGHAVMMAKSSLEKTGTVLIWPGDMPLVKAETIREFVKSHRSSQAGVSVLSASVNEPRGYGRILRANGRLLGIREELDADECERQIREINTGIYLFEVEELRKALAQIKPANAKNEYYLTDAIEILVKEGVSMNAFPLSSEEEAQGINSREQLASAAQKMNQRETVKHMDAGVTIVSPEQTYIESDVQIGTDTVIYPWTFIETGVKIGKKCQIGPFAKIRKGTVLGNEVVVGSFVEVSRSKLGDKVLAKHLTYLGDAEVGAQSNIGAGTITANFDGVKKNRTKIGKKVFVGSNTVLVAPVAIGDYARTGAGTVILGKSKIQKGSLVVGIPGRVVQKKR